MSRSPSSPLQRAVERLGAVLDSRDAARRWYEAYLAALGPRAVVDTCDGGTLSWVHRRAAGSERVLATPSVEWTSQGGARGLLWGLVLRDGRQRMTILYGEDGRIAERSLDDRYPGRLVELTRVIGGSSDGFAASVAFVASLGDERHGPGRVHYPVAVPSGVRGAWHVGRLGCRRALHDGRVPDAARFVVSDGLEGAAVGWGATQAEAEAAYAASVARALPETRHEVHTATDDYDDDGNLIARGTLPPGMDDGAAPDGPRAASVVWEPASEEGEAWKHGGGEHDPAGPPPPQFDPETGCIDFGTFTLRGPPPDVEEPPRRAECVPHVVIALDPPMDLPVARGRWVRLLGENGVTRHALRIEERQGFLLIGSDLLDLVDLERLRADLDAADVHAPDLVGLPGYERFVRYRAHQYRWSPATTTRPEGLAWSAGGAGPRFDAGGLDGDLLQAMVYRHRRVPRPSR